MIKGVGVMFVPIFLIGFLTVANIYSIAMQLNGIHTGNQCSKLYKNKFSIKMCKSMVPCQYPDNTHKQAEGTLQHFFSWAFPEIPNPVYCPLKNEF